MLLSAVEGFAQGSFLLQGTVTDAASGEPLAAANIRVLGTSKGTISNARGSYSISLDAGEHTIVFSYLAYQPDTLRISIQESLLRDIQLQPSPIQIPEVLVLAEDPAIDIIRKAIANKHTWMEKLKSYRFDAFTRQVLWRDTAIASITEAYTTGFMQSGDTLREVVKQRRQTQNIPSSENFAAVRRVVNFNEDEINLFSFTVNSPNGPSITRSYTFTGPTAPAALDNYNYKLLKTSEMRGVEIYDIKMTPKSRLQPLFDGTISIASGTYAVVGVDVRPNEALTFPFVKDVDLRYRQQFALYDSTYWMPADMRVDGGFSISLVGLSMPRIKINLASTIYDYAINATIPDSIFSKPHLVVDSSVVVFDSTFWSSNQVLPLTPEEQKAYTTLDSTQTLEKQFEPKGPLATLGEDRTETILDVLDFRFNRVEGFFFGARNEFKNISPYLNVSAAAGVGISDQRFEYELGSTAFTSKDHHVGIGGEVYSKLDNVPDDGFYGPLLISLMALIDQNDYRDYYLSRGWRMFVTADPMRALHSALSFTSENQSSMETNSYYSLFSRTSAYRPNPPIKEGKLRSIRLDLRLGPEESPLDIISRNALEISVEHTSPSLASSDFEFTRYHGLLTWNITTFSRSLLFPPTLRIRLTSGIGLGSLPPQEMFVLDSRSSGYAPFGVLRGSYIKEFTGDRFVMLNLEHNFRSIPFLLLNIPSFYRNGIEFIVHGSVAQTWYGTASTSGGWYAEAGLGISRILDLLRMDVTYRFMAPTRFLFTMSIANLF